ncbi:hypothetical protein XSR1_790006 [Xenorhabdus szentirmaii DSM 16338]|uniref:Uncharacterized protein n=1 Tax=Xenorhabdus szentirmaii DSM 16338 TaxID=1427518 RepID=W1J449_9GAMM|nr:hypothetical protein XSR1_790006 [Xenorhabdus szentirmaii DSM 16338]
MELNNNFKVDNLFAIEFLYIQALSSLIINYFIVSINMKENKK